MSQTVDARGLSCPQPVLDTLAAIREMGKGEIVVLVDTEASKENVSRAAESKGWRVAEVAETGSEYRISIVRE